MDTTALAQSPVSTPVSPASMSNAFIPRNPKDSFSTTRTRNTRHNTTTTLNGHSTGVTNMVTGGGGGSSPQGIRTNTSSPQRPISLSIPQKSPPTHLTTGLVKSQSPTHRSLQRDEYTVPSPSSFVKDKDANKNTFQQQQKPPPPPPPPTFQAFFDQQQHLQQTETEPFRIDHHQATVTKILPSTETKSTRMQSNFQSLPWGEEVVVVVAEEEEEEESRILLVDPLHETSDKHSILRVMDSRRQSPSIENGNCNNTSAISTTTPGHPVAATSTTVPQVLRTSSFASSEVKSDKSHMSTPTSDTPEYYHNHQQQQQNHSFSFLPPMTFLDSQEQALFEQRLTQDLYGIAVRKINSNGKSQLRYVKCETIRLTAAMSHHHGGVDGNHNNKKSLKMGSLNMSKSLPVTLNHGGGGPWTGYSSSSITSSKKIVSHDATATTTTTTASNCGTSLNCLASIGSHRNESSSSIHDKMMITTTTTDIPNSNASIAQDITAYNSSLMYLNTTSITNRSRADSTTSSAATTTATSVVVGGVGASQPRHGTMINENGPKKFMDESLDGQQGYVRVLAWGNKKKLKIPLSKFIAVHKGKTTDRTRKNTCPASRLLSLISTDPIFGSLDIEAPTQLDRDKFAVAFSQFLHVPLVEEDEVDPMTTNDGLLTTGGVTASKAQSTHSVVSAPIVAHDRKPTPVLPSMGYSVPDEGALKKDSRVKGPNLTARVKENTASMFVGAVETDNKGENPTIAENIKRLDGSHKIDENKNNLDYSSPRVDKDKGGVVLLDWKSSDIKSNPSKTKQDLDARSQVSSLTQVIDEEIIEELHQTITELRAELEASRAEAARAVKVAEQAIQSAESCSSNDWNSTVTHKAAEAAALAQKRSAEAMARQRKAEENLAEERKNAAYWRKQAELADGEVHKLRIRVAAAEAQKVNASETLQDIKSNTGFMVELVKRDAEKSEEMLKGKLQVSEDRTRALEALVEKSKRIVKRKDDEIKKLQVALTDAKSVVKMNIFNRGGTKKTNDLNHDSSLRKVDDMKNDSAATNYSHIQSEIITLRSQLRSLRREAVEEFKQLPKVADDYLHQVGDYMKKNLTELALVKERLALEASCRRKLLHELQDLRGNIRTYCRPMLKSGNISSCILSSPADDTCVLNEEFLPSEADGFSRTNGVRFEFDKVFPLGSSQAEIYSELEGTIIDVLNGYNVCMMTYGPSGTGKTLTIMGHVEINDTSTCCEVCVSNAGVAFHAVQQLFEVAKHRRNTFKDSFTFCLIEVHNEKLVDLLGSISPATNGNGKIVPQKLEIKTNHDGDTIIQGAMHTPFSSHSEFKKIWTDAISSRVKRLQDEGIDRQAYEASCHTIATVNVVSTSMTNGSGTTGKIHFVDLAASDAVIRRNSITTKSRTNNKSIDILAPVGNNQDWKFVNKSISVLADVAISRAQFSRNVPYRNSTITHLLRDSLEADTKVILLVCVGCDAENLQDTANALRFASVMRNIVVGKATKHLLT